MGYSVASELVKPGIAAPSCFLSLVTGSWGSQLLHCRDPGTALLEPLPAFSHVSLALGEASCYIAETQEQPYQRPTWCGLKPSAHGQMHHLGSSSSHPS